MQTIQNTSTNPNQFFINHVTHESSYQFHQVSALLSRKSPERARFDRVFTNDVTRRPEAGDPVMVNSDFCAPEFADWARDTQPVTGDDIDAFAELAELVLSSHDPDAVLDVQFALGTYLYLLFQPNSQCEGVFDYYAELADAILASRCLTAPDQTPVN